MIKADIEKLLQPVVAALGFELWGFEYLTQGKYSLLRIYIDKDQGIGVDDCERVSKQISATLDVEDPISGQYYLEISSPGIPRPLFYTEHYQRYINHKIMLKLHQPLNASRKVCGIILDVKESVIVLQVDEKNYELPFSQIIKANLIGE